MAKLILSDIGSLVNHESARESINNNFTEIEQAVDELLSRDGATPNQMTADLDMNSKRIMNVADAITDGEAVNVRTARKITADAGSGDTAIRQDLASSASGKGAALVGFLQAGTGAVARTVASKLGESVSIADFGGVGDDVANNAAAFAAAEASPHERIYLPQGTYYAAGVGSFQLTKFYYGPGTVRLDGPGYTPGRFTQLMTSPMKGAGTDANYYFSGDTSRVDPEYFVLGSSNANVRQSLTEQYFESTTTPHFEYFVNYSGGSGGDARLTVAAAINATSVTVTGTGGLANGNTIGFWNVTNGAQVHTATISGIAGNVVSFSPPLPVALGVGSAIGRGKRTMQQFRFTQLNHLGQGDAYCQTYRVTSSYVPLSGQDHFFYTSTAGVIGGDITHGTDGCYSTTFEFNAGDGGKDVAHIAFVESFNRNFTGATGYGAVWLGTFFKSEGAGYADAAHVVSGKWKRGLDTVLMSPNADKAAINMGPDQRIYFDSTATADPKLGLVHYGDTIGDTYIEYNTAAGALVHFTNGAPTLHLHPAYSLFFNNIVTQGSVAVPTNGKFYLEDNNSDTYLTYNGTNILLVKNGATVATW